MVGGVPQSKQAPGNLDTFLPPNGELEGLTNPLARLLLDTAAVKQSLGFKLENETRQSRGIVDWVFLGKNRGGS